jgi:Lon protease-like protein
LLGASIIHFQSNENGTLVLAFSNGHRLRIVDSFEEYESYGITGPGRTIVV